jgi:AbiV family abortive infection protein
MNEKAKTERTKYLETQLFREASKLSLENAEQWAKDAKLLVNASSLKHAFVLMEFAYEETAKFLVCWHISEGIWPVKGNALAEIVFKNHTAKIHILFGFLLNLIQGEPLKDPFRVDYSKDVKYIERHVLFKNLAFFSDKLRQICTHVDIDLKRGIVLTPENMGTHSRDIITYEVARDRLQSLECTIKYMRNVFEGSISEQDRNRLRDFYGRMPKEAWKTGEIPIEWVEKTALTNEGVKP